MGVGLLYHLAEEGCTDSLLIEKGELTSGSTWHAAGQCPSLVGNYNLAKIHAYSNDLYPRLEEITGQYVLPKKPNTDSGVPVTVAAPVSGQMYWDNSNIWIYTESNGGQWERATIGAVN